ncbi:hypothetical protein [Burkholderia sp. WAC0059]|uniref:hypothetical protein n=1 Tax=Burkholderia sp. WAC0059 TaxID=2066022 RepID=UPI0011AF266A|nr:hypothetical protein [Burkholderia sp. WAC0059]
MRLLAAMAEVERFLRASAVVIAIDDPASKDERLDERVEIGTGLRTGDGVCKQTASPNPPLYLLRTGLLSLHAREAERLRYVENSTLSADYPDAASNL